MPVAERLTWLGHSTVLLETAGVRLLTDPLLRGRVAHLRRHAPLSPLPQGVDAVLISHLHHDHLDVASVRMLDPAVPLVVPRGAARTRAVRSLRRTVHELDAGETIAFGDAVVRAVPAVHEGRRYPHERPVPALGFVVEGPTRVYYSGDTELFGDMAEVAGGADVALLPVWGWGGRLGPGHMDPDQAAQAAALLRPALAVPIHWGTFLPYGAHHRHGRLLQVPGTVFAERVALRAPGVRVVVLAPGESLPLGDRSAAPA